LDEEKSKHAGLAQQNGLHSCTILAEFEEFGESHHIYVSCQQFLRVSSFELMSQFK
jgi:hypothetical protein